MSKNLHLKIEMANVSISTLPQQSKHYLVAAMTKKGSHTHSVMHVALSVFLELIIIFCKIIIEMYCLNVFIYSYIFP